MYKVVYFDELRGLVCLKLTDGHTITFCGNTDVSMGLADSANRALAAWAIPITPKAAGRGSGRIGRDGEQADQIRFENDCYQATQQQLINTMDDFRKLPVWNGNETRKAMTLNRRLKDLGLDQFDKKDWQKAKKKS